MNLFVAVTDNRWFRCLASRPGLDEVNFWPPSAKPLATLSPGQPVLFKLHHPEHYIAGGGFFTTFSVLPVSIAWDAFGEKNGAASLEKLRALIENRMHEPAPRTDDYDPTLVPRRLGQGAFRVLVTETYGRRCAVTGEPVLPVLDAAHIRPVSQGGLHSLSNGLLLRTDVHTLFDRGYVTVTCQPKAA
jgi:hypothetical protein